jgi:hypothetical protein
MNGPMPSDALPVPKQNKNSVLFVFRVFKLEMCMKFEQYFAKKWNIILVIGARAAAYLSLPLPISLPPTHATDGTHGSTVLIIISSFLSVSLNYLICLICMYFHLILGHS